MCVCLCLQTHCVTGLCLWFWLMSWSNKQSAQPINDEWDEGNKQAMWLHSDDCHTYCIREWRVKNSFLKCEWNYKSSRQTCGSERSLCRSDIFYRLYRFLADLQKVISPTAEFDWHLGILLICLLQHFKFEFISTFLLINSIYRGRRVWEGCVIIFSLLFTAFCQMMNEVKFGVWSTH